MPDTGRLRRRRVEQVARAHERIGRGRHVIFGLVKDAAGLAALQDGLGMLRDRIGRLRAALPWPHRRLR